MTIPTTFNRHYPFAQRDFSFVFPWDVTKLALSRFTLDQETPKGNGIDLFVDDITKVIDEPDLLPAFPLHYGDGKTHDYVLTSSTPSGLPAGWTANGSARVQVFVRIRNQPSGFFDLQRPNRRVHKLDFGMSTRAFCAVGVVNPSPFGDYRIGIEGYWKNFSGDDTPGFPDPFWEEADTPPTLHRLNQKGHRDYHRQFVPADWVLTTKTTSTAGTVPTDVKDFMDAWLDDLEADLSGATLDATWRLAGIGWGLPTDIGNRNFIFQSSAGDRY
jgi:hypothetical protein